MNHPLPFPWTPDSLAPNVLLVCSPFLYPPPGHSKFFAETGDAIRLGLAFRSTRKTDKREGVRATVLALTLSPREREFAPCGHSYLSIYPPPPSLYQIPSVHQSFVPLMIHMIPDKVISLLATGVGPD